MKSNIIDLELWLHAETEAAILVSTHGELNDAVWLPKSAIEVKRGSGFVNVTLPEALAIDKGLC